MISTMKTTPAVLTTTLALALTGAGLSARGSALYSIGVLNTNAPYSEIRALSHDGTYAVGTSTSAGLYSGGSPHATPAAPEGTNAPVLWSLAGGLVELPCPSHQHTIATGVAIGISNNLGNIIISGLHEGYLTHRFYKVLLSDPASGAWVDTSSTGGLGGVSNLRQGGFNNCRTHPGHDGRWYTAGRRNDTGRNARFRGDPNSGWDGTAVNNVQSVSAYGINVGRSMGTPSSAFYEGPALTYGTVPGSTGFRADGFGISSSFGKATDFDTQWICGQVQNYGDFQDQMQAFRWKRGDESMSFLGALPGASSSVAYAVANNGLTGGRSYFGAYEQATVWDTSGTWDTTGEPKSLKALLEADGVDTSAWTWLTRVHAVSDDGRVVAGIGVWAEDGSTRGFVAVKSVGAVVQITHVSVAGSNLTIHFTSSNPADTPASFAVVSSAAVDGTFSEVTASISGSAGTYQATLSLSGPVRFYRIKRP